MPRKSIIWNILPYYLLIIFLSLLSISWYSSKTVKDFHKRDIARSLEERARIVEMHLSGIFPGMEAAEIDSLCDQYGDRSEMRITVIDPGGVVRGDSEEDPARMENHADRPEIIKALSGSVGVSERHSGTLNQNFIYVAVPLVAEGEIRGVVRASIPLTEVEGSLSDMYRRLFLAGVVATLLAGLLSLLVSRRISIPIEEMKKGIEHFEEEDLEYRIPTQGLSELGELARVINSMASKLKDRIDTVELQKNEQEAVFSAIPEGILVLDEEEKIVRMNPGAAELLGTSPAEARGKSIQEVARNPQLQRFVAETLSSRSPVETDFALWTGTADIFVQAKGVTLKSFNGNGAGAVIVLNNVTRIKKLENVRREFVANVSHELRTPVTAVKGFVETLLEGAIQHPAEAEKFLQIIDRQADRMNRIIGDLLLLAQVEREEETGGIRFEKTNIREILDDARQVCASKAADKSIIIEISCAEELEARANPALLEQAIINLVDNAINYSPDNSKVTVKAYRENGRLALDVIDRGCGIEPEYQSRLFERFYRIDKARSRKQGGTGL
ncbi:MAG: PAS domain S-box protein, partial [Candidatus Krumholzibacteriota bacterium]|nr:PAS domain S-box protein [Candidatus Krumholzibacteriota bacterium]